MRKPFCLLALAILVSLLHSCGPDKASDISTIKDLDRRAVLHFSVFSDNKGESPASSVEFARMENWIRGSNSAFVIGLGDHLKNRWENSFVPWIKSDDWWHTHTYLNVADGENEYYSETHKQSDYGAGAPILNLVKLDAHATIRRANPSEYYAVIPAGKFTVHLIQLHYSDQPKDPSIAFPESSRAWLVETLEGIDKGKYDLIVVGAHSRAGSWDMVLSPERRKILLGKADLVLSATTHRYQSWVPEGFEDLPAVCVNTGAVNFPGYMTPNGYVDIHVLNSGDIVGQYIDLTQTERRLQRDRFAWVKPKDGPMRHIDLRYAAAGDNTDEHVAALADSVLKEEIEEGLSDLLRKKTGADLAYAEARTGLSRGPVTREDAWRVFGRNKNYRVLKVPSAQIDTLLSRYRREPIENPPDPVRIALTQSLATSMIGWTGLTYESLEPQPIQENGIRQVPLLLEWLRSR